jgi:hypoxanthine phosphoribosyltransferase
MAVSPEQAWDVYAAAECLYTRAQVETALDRLAAAISARLAKHNPLLLCVMTGGVVPVGCLLPRLDFPLELDYVHATRYQGTTRGGTLEWRAAPRCPLQGRSVLIVDDILDEGNTLAAIVDHCRSHGAATAHTAVLVEKQLPRAKAHSADFVGLTVPNRYVFGYGMDYHEYLRNAPGIYAVAGL